MPGNNDVVLTIDNNEGVEETRVEKNKHSSVKKEKTDVGGEGEKLWGGYDKKDAALFGIIFSVLMLVWILSSNGLL